MDAPIQAERTNLPFFHLFVLLGPSADWKMPARIGKGNQSPLLSLMIPMIISSLKEIPRNNILSAVLAYFSAVKLTHKITITGPFLYIPHREESAHLGCWQNSFPCDYKTENPGLLLAFAWRLSSAPRHMVFPRWLFTSSKQAWKKVSRTIH